MRLIATIFENCIVPVVCFGTCGMFVNYTICSYGAQTTTEYIAIVDVSIMDEIHIYTTTMLYPL